MRLTEITYDEGVPVEGYGPGFFRIDGQVLRGDLLVTARGARSWGGYDDLAALRPLVGAVDVLLVGTGAEIAPLPPAFRAGLEERGIGVENMPSPAACRTYNMLLAEGRRVALALFAQ